jgi:hypothetical protein
MQPNEHESGGTEPREFGVALMAPAWIPLLPASIVAVGNPEQPLEQLLTLQSAIARLVHLVTVAGRLRPKLRLNGLPRATDALPQ